MRIPAAWWDERRPGGRLKGWLFVLHPGPSLLVTATFVAVTGLAARSAPSPARAVQLAAAMLSVQFTIGIANDLADRQGDARIKRYKPLVRGLVAPVPAAVAAVLLAATGLGLAATLNPATLAFFGGGLAAGLSYDFGLRRTPLSLLPWWAGVVMLPLAAFAAAGELTPRLWLVVPLGGLIAFGLHLANGAPDAGADRGTGRRSLPVLLGERWSLHLASTSLATVVALGVGVGAWLGRAGWWVGGGAVLLLGAVAVAVLWRVRRPFPLLATCTAVFAATWLATVPGA